MTLAAIMKALGAPRKDARRKWPFVASMAFQGIPIDIEQRKGDSREGVDKDGTPWKVKMRAHYGEIRRVPGTEGAKGMDGDRLDVYVGPDDDSPLVVVVDQRIPETGEHDEQKVMIGFPSVQAALDCYRGQYTKPGFYGGHQTMTIDGLKRWMGDRDNAGARIAKSLAAYEVLARLAAEAANRPSVPLTLQRLMDATWTLAQRAQRYHWNVTGPTFSELHGLFGDQYDEANGAVDEIAERMRALGVPDVRPTPQPEAYTVTTEPAEQVRLLLVAHQDAAQIANDLARVAEDAGDAGTVDLAGRRALAHEKAAWMLRATAGLQKAGGPYIGPHGGKWADPAHTVPWKPPGQSVMTMHHGNHHGSMTWKPHAGACLTPQEESAQAYATQRGTMHDIDLDVTNLRVKHLDSDDYDRDDNRAPGDSAAELAEHAKDSDVIVYDDEDERGRRHKTYRLVTPAAVKAAEIASRKKWDDDEDEWREADSVSKASGLAILLDLLKAKFIRKVPTGKTTKTGKPVYRYIYHDAGATHAAASGEHVNLHKRGVHEVVDVTEHGVTLRHAKTGAERIVSHEDFHNEVANAHKRQFDRAAETMVRKVLSVSDIAADPNDPDAVMAELRDRFDAAGIDIDHAQRIIGALAHREGWSTDAKKAMLALASDRLRGRDISANARQVMHGAENLSRADGSKEVEARHVHRAADIRTPSDTFNERLADARTKVAAELAQAKALLGAVEAAGDNESARRAMVDYASTVLNHGATSELDQMAEAFPALRNLPEIVELHRVRAQWQGIMAERDQRRAGSGGIQGAPTTIYVADANGSPTPQVGRYRLIESADAIASHDPNRGFMQRKDYPAGVQERSYHGDKAEQEKVRGNAQKLAPAFVINTNPDAVNGPPVMTKDGIVLGGNSRTMSVQLAYKDHPEAAKAYREYLTRHAHEFGLAQGDVAQMQAPMLVREVDVGAPSKGELGTLVRRYNESFTQGMDPRVDQVARGRLVTQGMIDAVASGMDRTNDAGEPVHATLKDFLGSGDGQRFVSELSSAREGKAVIDRRNRSQFIGKDGKLNEDGKTFVERVLVGHAIPDPDLLSEMLPKHVSALAAVVPHVVRAASKGHDLHAPLKTALDAHAYMRRKGLKSVREYENDSGGFGSMGIEGFEQKPQLDDTARAMLDTLVDKFDKPTQLAAHFREFANLARQNPAGQADLTGESRTTGDLLKLAASRTKTGTRDLFKASGLALLVGALSGHEIPEFMALALMRGIAKAAHHKYLRKVPTGKYTKTGKPQFRYYYTVGGGKGLGHHEEIKAGAAFRMKDGGKDGHFVVTEDHGDGHVTIRHDESGAEHRLHKDALAGMLRSEHAEALQSAADKAKASALATLKEARESGSAKHVERAKREAKQRGASEDETTTPEERKAKEPPPAPEPVKPVPEPEPIPQAMEAATAEAIATVQAEPRAPVAENDSGKSFAYSQSQMPNFLGLRTDRLKIKWVDTGGQYKQAVMDEQSKTLRETGFYAALDSWSRGFLAGIVGKLKPSDAKDLGLDPADTRDLRTISDKQAALYNTKILPKLAAWWASMTDGQRMAFAEEFGDPKLQARLANAPEPKKGFAGQDDMHWTVPPGMEKMQWKLHDYQIKAVNFATEHAEDGRSLLAMEMGLGKTLSAVAAFHKLKAEGKVKQAFITAPSSAHGSWDSHFRETSDARVGFVGTGMTPKARQALYDAFQKGDLDVLVTTPDSLGNDADKIAAMIRDGSGPRNVMRVADEAHLYKNPAAKRTKAFREIMTEPAGHVIAMTGTVKPNKAEDFYHLMRAINPRIFGQKYNIERFAQDFCYTQWNRFKGRDGGYDILGFKPDAMPKLHEINAKSMFVRTKSDPDVNLAIPDRQELAPRVDQDDVQTFFHEMLGNALGANSIESQYKRMMDRLAEKISPELVDSVDRDLMRNNTWGFATGTTPKALNDYFNVKELKAAADAEADRMGKPAPMPPREPRATGTGPYSMAVNDEWYGYDMNIKRYPEARKLRSAQYKVRAFGEVNKYLQDTGEGLAGLHDAMNRGTGWKKAAAVAAREAAKNPLTAMTASLAMTSDPRLVSGMAEHLPDYKGSPKAQLIADAVAQHMENNPERGAVIFGTHVKALENMKASLVERGMAPEHVYVLHGQNKSSMREAEDGINSGKYKVVVGQVDMMNMGANMQQRANLVAFIDTPPKPATITQAIARVHRQGQKDKVTVLRPVGSPMEARVEAMVASKIRQSSMLQGKEMDADRAVLSGIDASGDLNHDAIREALGVAPRKAVAEPALDLPEDFDAV